MKYTGSLAQCLVTTARLLTLTYCSSLQSAFTHVISFDHSNNSKTYEVTWKKEISW
jgi:hypothetical protein